MYFSKSDGLKLFDFLNGPKNIFQLKYLKHILFQSDGVMIGFGCGGIESLFSRSLCQITTIFRFSLFSVKIFHAVINITSYPFLMDAKFANFTKIFVFSAHRQWCKCSFFFTFFLMLDVFLLFWMFEVKTLNFHGIF